jgi:hypothetical protein
MDSARLAGYRQGAIQWAAEAWDGLRVEAEVGLRAKVTEIPVQPLDPSRSEGIGSALAIRESPLQLFWTRPYSRSWTKVRWARYDVTTGTLTSSGPGSGLRGDLVDWFPAGDRHAWFLLTHGLMRVDLQRMTPEAVPARGFPKWMSKLLVLRAGLLGSTGWTGATTTVVDTETLSVRRILRMPSPDALWSPGGGPAVELLSFNGETARSVDLVTLALGPPRRLPLGKWPLVRGDRAWIVRGTKRVDPRAPRIRAIDGERVAEVDLQIGKIVRASPRLPAPERVKGVDRLGRILVLCQQGFVLLHRDTLEPVLDVRHRWGTFGDISILPDGASAAALPNSVGPERLALIAWDA